MTTAEPIKPQRLRLGFCMWVAGMKKWYLQWGYETLEVLRTNIDERISFILETIDRTLANCCS